MPRRSLRSVISRTSQMTARDWVHDPMLEMVWPTKYRVKFRFSNAANRGEVALGAFMLRAGTAGRCRWPGRRRTRRPGCASA